MAFEQKPNAGQLFRSDYHTKDTDPTHTGTADIGGVLYKISAWVNESKGGKKYFSLKFSENPPAGSYQAKPKAAPAPAAQPAHKDFADDLPF